MILKFKFKFTLNYHPICAQDNMQYYFHSSPLHTLNNVKLRKLGSLSTYSTFSNNTTLPEFKYQGLALPPLTYSQVLNLESSEIRRIKSDIKLCFQIVNGLCDLDPSEFFELLPQSSVTRGHSMKLIKPICYTNCQLNFFSSRVVNYWNSLPLDIVNAVSFGSFVNRLKSQDSSVFCESV